METGGAIVINTNLFPEGCRHKAKPDDGPTPFFFPPLLLPLPCEGGDPNRICTEPVALAFFFPVHGCPRSERSRDPSCGDGDPSAEIKKEDEYREPTKNMRVCTTSMSSRAWGTGKVFIFGQGGQVRGRGQNFSSGLALRANRSAIV